MTAIDPVLKQLVADGDDAEGSIPLTLYLPSGALSGYTTTHDDFGRYCTHELEQYSGTGCVVAPAAGSDYVHLIIENPLLISDDEPEPPKSVVRVRLADVVAWTC